MRVDSAVVAGTEVVLVVEDDQDFRDLIVDCLAVPDRRVMTAGTAVEAMGILRAETPAVVLIDIGLPDISGLELLSEALRLSPNCLAIIITGRSDEQAVVESMRRGAMDYLVKPFGMADLRDLVAKAFEKIRSGRTTKAGEAQPLKVSQNGSLVGRSGQMLEVFKLIGRLARTDVPVLITGESGTGKELVARALHHYGAKAAGPFVAVDCGGLPETLLESELFGYEKGAFTGATGSKPGRFELADGGTLFLDEIGNIPLLLQAKLLRVLQERSTQRLGALKSIGFDARLVTATNLNVKDLCAKGAFREDLLYRIAGAEIRIPPLRERPEDIEPLTDHVLGEIPCPRGRWVLAGDAMRLLLAYSWPGNVRELEHALHHAAALAQGHIIGAEDLPVEIHHNSVSLDADFIEAVGTKTLLTMQQVRKRYARHVLVACGGNRARAARILNIDRKTLNSLVREPGEEE